MREKISARLKQILAKELNIEISKINEDSRLAEDLGADSLDTTEIVMVIEEEFNYRLRDDDVALIKTVGDLLAILLSADIKENNS